MGTRQPESGIPRIHPWGGFNARYVDPNNIVGPERLYAVLDSGEAVSFTANFAGDVGTRLLLSGYPSQQTLDSRGRKITYLHSVTKF